MDPIGSGSAYNLPISSANPAEAAQTAARAQPSGHADSLTLARLSHHAFDALHAKETHGDAKEKRLAGFVKSAIKSGQLWLLPDQQQNGIVQFGMQSDHDVWVVKAKLNERSEYDVLQVGFTRSSEAPVSMELAEPEGDAANTARHPPALLNLPNELLLQIAGRTGPRGEGVDLNLRSVSKKMKSIADHQLSPEQRSKILAGRPVAERNFVLANTQRLHAVGYDGSYEMIALAAKPAAERDFVLDNAQGLHAVGYTGETMNALASRPGIERDFVLANAQRLHAVGCNGEAMNALAARPGIERDFVLANAQRLHAVGYNGEAMNALAAQPVDERNFVLTHAQGLKAAGYRDGYQMNALATRPDERNAYLRQSLKRD